MTSAGNISGLWPQIRADLNGKPYRPAGGVFVVEGTVYPGAPWPPIPDTDYGTGIWSGFASGVAGGLTNAADGLWYIETIGYPAVTTPMWPSILTGVTNLNVSVQNFARSYKAEFGVYPPLNIVGWSQGAAVIDLWYQTHVWPEDGDSHDLLPFLYTIYNFGDVLRCPGLSYGNDYAQLPPPGKLDGQTTGGIGGPRDVTVEQTNHQSPLGRPVILSFNNKGDLYGAAPVGDNPWKSLPSAGLTEYNFFLLIMQFSAKGLLVTGLDFFHLIGALEAGANAIKFFAAGNNAPHFLYWDAMTWIIGDLIRVGNSLPHELGV